MTDQPKRTYCVAIPIAGRATFEVEAIDEKSAIDAAWAAVDAGEDPDVEWEYLSEVTTGNVCHAPHNEVEILR